MEASVNSLAFPRAKEKKKTHRALWAAMGTLAACICIAMMLPKGILNDSSNQAQDEEIYKNIWIYYVKDGEVCKEQEYILAEVYDSLLRLEREKWHWRRGGADSI